MEKQILERGYVTYALTNEKGKIYGLNQYHSINFAGNKVEMEHQFYWSEVYREGNMAIIIRKGMLLVEPTADKLTELHKQSKINLN